jgi:hypothetical protein
MHAAGALQSDIDPAGLMVRCGSQDLEVLVVLVRPLPRALIHPTVRIGAPGEVISLTATVVPPGGGRSASEAGRIACETWQFAAQLVIEVGDDQNLIRGTVATGQLGSAPGAHGCLFHEVT